MGNNKSRGKDDGLSTMEQGCCWMEKKYSEETTCHGISCVFKHEKYWAKAAWSFILICFTSAMFYQAFLNLLEYLQFDSSTSVQRKYSTLIDFPAITFCNFNRFFRDFNEKLTQEDMDFIHHLNRVNSPWFYDHPETEEFVPRFEIPKMLSSGMYGSSMEEEVDPWSDFTYSEHLHQQGSDLKRELQFCSWGGERCDARNFTTILTRMGRCHIFNGGDKQVTQTSPGINKGLQIILDTQHWLYTEEERMGVEEAGIKFLVHSPLSSPNVQQYGFAIAPGKKAFATIKKKAYELLPKPWGQCDDKPKKLKYFDEYTMDGCLTECHTDLLIEACGCRTFYQGWASNISTECSVAELKDCATPKLHQIEQNFGMEECKCTIPCKFHEYEVSMTYATYPGKQIVDVYEDFDTVLAGYVRDNYVALDIGFDIIGYEKSVQSVSYTWQSLFSNFGGAFGLWTGTSLFTVVEFIYFIGKKIRFMLLRRNRMSSSVGAANNCKVRHLPVVTEQPTYLPT